jgi:hypothetical protein
VHRSDTGARKECRDGLPGHGHVHGDGVAFLDAEVFEDIGDAADLAEEFGVRNVLVVAWLVGLINDGNLGGDKNRRGDDIVKRTLSGCLKAQRSTQL